MGTVCRQKGSGNEGEVRPARRKLRAMRSGRLGWMVWEGHERAGSGLVARQHRMRSNGPKLLFN
jgi:hypothetical protein